VRLTVPQFGRNARVRLFHGAAVQDHAHALANFALEILQRLENRTEGPGSELRFRIGMNSGPVVGGVIGNREFHYDIWGDMVTVASRMESNGLPGKIQLVSGAQ
jgi:adenylate cyclase